MYHVALSFAGEDRDYVEDVATQLKADGVKVFYDKFEQVDLWGRNLYEHLSDIYQNKAHFTVMFISEAYKRKVWTNHERRSAQARAIEESGVYILPAFFDESIEVPGLLRTTHHIPLANLAPEQFASIIVEKLKSSGIKLRNQFSYSDHAIADIDFPCPRGNKVSTLIKAMKSKNYYTQAPAIEKIFSMDCADISPDDAFVLGRNLYQCAVGNEYTALGVLDDLRRELATLPENLALDFLNGMFYEVYFDAKGKFRGQDGLKARCLDKLLALQSAPKFSPSITFIRRALYPYRNKLIFRPNTKPETVIVDLFVRSTDPPTVRLLKIGDASMLSEKKRDDNSLSFSWRLALDTFTVDELADQLSNEWGIPIAQLKIRCRPKLDSKTRFRLPKGWSVIWPRKK